MTLSHIMLNEMIEFHEGKVNVLIIENPLLFRNSVHMLLRQADGEDCGFVLSENYNIIEFSKAAEVLTDPFSVTVNSKKITGRLNKLAEELLYENGNDIGPLLCELNSLGGMLTTLMPFDVSFNEIGSISKVIELLGLHIDEETELPERMLDYMRVYRSLMNKSLFIFINLKSCLSAEETECFYKSIIYERFNVLLIEPFQSEAPLPLESMKIIDKDMCEL